MLPMEAFCDGSILAALNLMVQSEDAMRQREAKEGFARGFAEIDLLR